MITELVKLATGLVLPAWIVVVGLIAIVVFVNTVLGKVSTYFLLGLGALFLIYTCIVA